MGNNSSAVLNRARLKYAKHHGRPLGNKELEKLMDSFAKSRERPSDVRIFWMFSEDAVDFIVEISESLLDLGPQRPEIVDAVEAVSSGGGLTFEAIKGILFDMTRDKRELLSQSMNRQASAHDIISTKSKGFDFSSWIDVGDPTSGVVGGLSKDVWALVFEQLSYDDLKSVSLTNRAFYYSLRVSAPKNWRCVRLTSLEQRTNMSISEFVQARPFSMTRHLYIGTPDLGTMLTGADLAKVLTDLRHLTTLSLSNCRLVREAHWHHLRCPTLRALCLLQTESPPLWTLVRGVAPGITSVSLGNNWLAHGIDECSKEDLQEALQGITRACWFPWYASGFAEREPLRLIRVMRGLQYLALTRCAPQVHRTGWATHDYSSLDIEWKPIMAHCPELREVVCYRRDTQLYFGYTERQCYEMHSGWRSHLERLALELDRHCFQGIHLVDQSTYHFL